MSNLSPNEVLVLTSTFPRHADDSIPPFVLRLCQAVAKQGWRSLVLAPHAESLKVHDEIEGITCRRFRYAPARWEKLAYGGGMLANVREARWRWLLLPFYLLSLFLNAAWFIWRRDIRVVHAHWVIPQGVIAVALKKIFWWKRIRLVMTAHGSDLNVVAAGKAGRFLALVMQHADVVAVVSQAMKQKALSLGVSVDRIVIAPMGVDMELFCPPLETGKRNGVLFVGRLVESKGVLSLLSAFHLLLQVVPTARLRIVGDGPMRSAMQAKAQELGLQQHLEFMGAKPACDVAYLLQTSSLFIMSSQEEGLGLVVIEAMACECPVVAFELPALRGILITDETGYVVPQQDIKGLAHAACLALSDEDAALALAAKARSRVMEQYGWSAVAERYAGLYQASQ